MKYSKKDIDTLFKYHNPSDIDVTRFAKIREAAKELGCMIIEHGGKDVDQERSIQKLRECVFYAIASIVVPNTGENNG